MSKPNLAIFDLDNTILNGDSDYSMINYLVDINLLDEVAKLRNDEFIQDYQQGQLPEQLCFEYQEEYCKFALGLMDRHQAIKYKQLVDLILLVYLQSYWGSHDRHEPFQGVRRVDQSARSLA